MAIQTGQHNIPPQALFRKFFNGIFERQYYTESGPLVQQLEKELEHRLGVGHAICISNASIAWIMLLEAGLEQRRLVAPVTAPMAFREGSLWTRSELIICDVDAANDFRLAKWNVEPLLSAGVDCVVGVNQWGGAAEIDGLLSLCRDAGVRLYFDSSESFGSTYQGRPIGALGDAEVFSFDAANVINGAGGACICTDDALLADRIRCMRGSGGVRNQVPVAKTVNGRMSEAQAAFALMSMEALDDYRARNQLLHDIYAKGLSSISGMRLLSAVGVSQSNYQQAVIAVDERQCGMSKSQIIKYLQDHAVLARPLDVSTFIAAEKGGMTNLLGAAAISSTVIELPLGSATTASVIEGICSLLRECSR